VSDEVAVNDLPGSERPFGGALKTESKGLIRACHRNRLQPDVRLQPTDGRVEAGAIATASQDSDLFHHAEVAVRIRDCVCKALDSSDEDRGGHNSIDELR
jgi:hypothetical protein